MNDNVSVVIPGASKSYQVDSNMAASALPELSEEQMRAIKEIYEEDIKPHVHHLW